MIEQATEFEKKRGLSRVEVRDGFAQVHVSRLAGNVMDWACPTSSLAVASSPMSASTMEALWTMRCSLGAGLHRQG